MPLRNGIAGNGTRYTKSIRLNIAMAQGNYVTKMKLSSFAKWAVCGNAPKTFGNIDYDFGWSDQRTLPRNS